MDISVIIGVFIGILAIFGTLQMEGGALSSVLQPTAAIIVFGGIIGAGLVNFPISVVSSSLKELKDSFFESSQDLNVLIENICQLSGMARHEGVLVIQKLLPEISEPALKQALSLSLDTNDKSVLEEILFAELKMQEEKGLVAPLFFEALGGYAPTFGIIGAVIGLIQVMSSIENPAELGRGISTAFVATLYGVGVANLIFLPLAGKLRYRLREKLMYKNLLIQGILCIHKGENPVLIREKLRAYV